MQTQNITLALPKAVLRRVKLLAVEKQTSVSALLARTLEEMVDKEDAYANARQRHLARLKNGIDMETGGSIRWKRDNLHDR